MIELFSPTGLASQVLSRSSDSETHPSADNYAKDGGPGEVLLLCIFYRESLRTWIKTIVNKFAISNHMALVLGVHALRSYLELICE